jgi:hypothetical protein
VLSDSRSVVDGDLLRGDLPSLTMVPMAVVEAIVSDADRKISALEREASAALQAAEDLEAKLALEHLDASSSSWAMVQLHRFVEVLRADSERAAADLVQEAGASVANRDAPESSFVSITWRNDSAAASSASPDVGADGGARRRAAAESERPLNVDEIGDDHAEQNSPRAVAVASDALAADLATADATVTTDDREFWCAEMDNWHQTADATTDDRDFWGTDIDNSQRKLLHWMSSRSTAFRAASLVALGAAALVHFA